MKQISRQGLCGNVTRAGSCTCLAHRKWTSALVDESSPWPRWQQGACTWRHDICPDRGLSGRFARQGCRLPEDVSVVGFDDLPGAAFANPGLTTVRQPLVRMERIAAQTLVDRIEKRGRYAPEIAIEPEFIVRQSTAEARSRQTVSSPRRMDKSGLKAV